MTLDTAAKHRILIADDEPHIGRIIQMKLEQGPFEVLLAEDGEAALDAIEREPDIALVVLDLMMPKLSGLDVLSRLRAHDATKTLPTIILTAAGEEDQQRNAMRLGATEFLTKPFSPKKLYTMVAQLLGVPVAPGATGEHLAQDKG
ncbi:MAG TPA: response regulator transcription factor [Gemmatimonadaceae bacterium]|nr:response regulator transcription factor [Gemmatimonadaceae bacterium]